MKTILAISLLTSGLVSLSVGAERPFRVTLRVLDNEGQPVVAAKAGVGFEKEGTSADAERTTGANGLTDENGTILLDGSTWFNELHYGAAKAGYYRTIGLKFRFDQASGSRWEPWNPTIEVVLKRIKNPVPMYARTVTVGIPAKDAPVSYDLEVGDWIAPYGKGNVADMTFLATGEVKDSENFRGELTVTFPGFGNGIQCVEIEKPDGSMLRMPYEAPDEGYASKWTLRSVLWMDESHRHVVERIDGSNRERNFFFRVRSVVNGDGKVVQAYYGKIHAPFTFDPRGERGLPFVSFTYFLNPDGTRNVEFDPKRNLFKPASDRDSAFWNLGP